MDEQQQQQQPAHTGIPIKGGPTKIAGIKQSAADAQAARDEYAREHSTVGSGYGSGENVGDNANDDNPFPKGIHIKGGPDKISSIKLSAEEAARQRAEFDRELEEKFGEGGDGEDVSGDGDGDGNMPAGIRPRGGPNKIAGIMQSAKDAEEKRREAAGDGDCD